MQAGTSPKRLIGPLLATAVVLIGLTVGPAPADDGSQVNPLANGGPVTILDGSGVWRALCSWNSPLVQTDEGVGERRVSGRRVAAEARGDFRFMTLYPPAGWTRVDFDDSIWCRRHFLVKYSNGEWDSRAGGGSGSPYLRQLSLRGNFTVADPRKVGSLRLTLAYRGGAAVYLNGTELARADLPEGKLDPGSPAGMYPLKAYLKADGKPWSWWNDRQVIGKEAYPLRVRRIEKLAVPAKLLKEGFNVLAVEIHAAPFPEVFADPNVGPAWATCGLIEVRLQAARAEGIVPNVARPKGLRVWNTDIIESVRDMDWADPHEKLRPISLAGARNGRYSGRIVVSSDKPIAGLQASMSDLSSHGKGSIPAAGARVSYALFDGLGAQGAGLSAISAVRRDNAMADEPPQIVPVATKTLARGLAEQRQADGLPRGLLDGAVQPVYVTVRVPKDAAAGDYRGTLTIAANGEAPLAVPIELKVIDWTLPDPQDFAYWCGMIQSPEGVGLHYEVPLWSERHWELIGKSFDWIAQLGSKVLFIPLGAETEYGNGQSMVLWIKAKEGNYTHDFSRVEQYVDVALKHLGRPRFVVVGVWQPGEHKSGTPRISVKDAQTGAVESIDGPKHGSAESLVFWKPVLTKMHEILQKRGLGEAMLLGYGGDGMPDKVTVGVFHKILPTVGWQSSRHWPRGTEYIPYEGGRKPVMYQSNVWGCGDVQDPETRRVYGWNYNYPVKGGLRTWLDRGVYDTASLTAYRGMSENILLSDRPGQGQIGADFWPPPPEKKGARRLETLYSRFPRTRNVGAGNKGLTANQLLYPGPRGAVPTVRFEMIRENIQECEARIFLEKLLLAKPLRLPAELAKRIQGVLDERTRWQRLQRGYFNPGLCWPYSGWQQRTIKLYECAAQAARAIAPS